MRVLRLPFFLFFIVLAGFTLGSCQKKDDFQPQKVATPQLTNGSWRLDQILQNGVATSSGAGIKDRYSLKFRTDGTFTQTLLADNTASAGTWLLINNSITLRLTDNKGTASDYTLATLSDTELRYSFTNKNGQVEERDFSAQP